MRGARIYTKAGDERTHFVEVDGSRIPLDIQTACLEESRIRQTPLHPTLEFNTPWTAKIEHIQVLHRRPHVS
jgi:hypothetical protein